MRRSPAVFIPLFAAVFVGCGDEPSGSGSSSDASGGGSDVPVQDASTTVPDVGGSTDNGGPSTWPDLPGVEDADSGGLGDAPSGGAEVADPVEDADALGDAAAPPDGTDAADGVAAAGDGLADVDAAPAASDADAGGCGPVVEVDVSSNDELNKPWADLLLEGQGFEAYEDRTIYLTILSAGFAGPTGQGTAIITCGGFAFFAPDVLDYGGAIYKNIVLFIDEDGDGLCEVGVDAVWTHTTGASAGDKDILMTPTDPLWTTYPICASSF